MGWTWIDTLAITYVRQRIGGSAAARPGHVLDEHELLMPGAVVVHDRQQRQPVVHGRPKRSGRIVQISVTLHIDHEPPARLRGERRARAKAR